MRSTVDTCIFQLLKYCWPLCSAVLHFFFCCVNNKSRICPTLITFLVLFLFFLFYHIFTVLTKKKKNPKLQQSDFFHFFPLQSFHLLSYHCCLSCINIKQFICEDSHSSKSFWVISISHWSRRSEASPCRDFHHKRKFGLLLELLIFQLWLLLTLE